VIDVSAITDKKRAASVAARGGQEKSVSEGVVRGQAWDKIVSQAKQALEEVGYFSGSDLGPGHPETVAYTLKNGDIVPLSAKRVKLIQSLTGATELRGSSPKHGVAFYRAEKPVAVLMPIGASPDIDIDVARKAAVTSGPPKVKPDELPEKTPEP
jgi:hypothetical protein